MPASRLRVQRVAMLAIGRPVRISHGQLADRMIRVQLDELQGPVLGRKCGVKDRRPLDPPPVLQVRIFEVTNVGTPQEREHEFQDLRPVYLAASRLIQLTIRVGGSSVGEVQANSARTPSVPAIAHEGPSTSTAAPDPAYMPGQETSPTDVPFVPYPCASSDVFPAHTATATALTHGRVQADETADPSSNRVLAYINGFPIIQGACCTGSFVGTIQAHVSCYSLDGCPALLGIFHDLAVNTIGTFVVRYRVVNMLWGIERSKRPVVAECWGGPFEVYPASLFPGLKPSTELTKTLSKLGVPVTVRKNERKKRKKDPPESEDTIVRPRRLEKAPAPR